MKIAPVSADLLIKLALGAAAIGAAWWIVRRASSAASGALDAVGSAAQTVGTAINPASSDNLIYRGVNAIGGAASGSPGWNLGGWVYDVTHFSAPAVADSTRDPAVQPQGAW